MRTVCRLINMKTKLLICWNLIWKIFLFWKRFSLYQIKKKSLQTNLFSREFLLKIHTKIFSHFFSSERKTVKALNVSFFSINEKIFFNLHPFDWVCESNWEGNEKEIKKICQLTENNIVLKAPGKSFFSRQIQ